MLDVLLYLQKVAPIKFRSEEHTSELQSHLNLVCPTALRIRSSRGFIIQR